jgi:hypothetical protein
MNSVLVSLHVCGYDAISAASMQVSPSGSAWSVTVPV